MTTKKPKTNQTLETFKKLCQKYINYFGLHDFHVGYEMEDQEEGVACNYYLSREGGQVVTLALNSSFEFSPENLKLTAKHEIIEALVLGKIRDMLLNYYSENVVDEEIHRVVRMLENKIK